ncbi:hypothetical protein [Duganella phyllosphaerae]|uniref:Uncharacterized protein n=1 Tax=Duganella phyllosphaerae TaxID=762836 RepID=A0A1E7WVP9_9BURK|nr:hypothetical protein [Duganella phyllosphaerae]OFA03880.1 hypothetical protein DUPY_16950 [Duganella phyllosphaerae]
MHALASSSTTSHRNSRYQRLVMVFVLLFLALQLLGSNAHAHAYAENHTDCAACQVADMPLGDLPPPATVAPVAALVAYAPPMSVHHDPLVRTSCITPPSHAPPAAVLS